MSVSVRKINTIIKSTLYEFCNLKYILQLTGHAKYLSISQNKLGSHTETSINYKVTQYYVMLTFAPVERSFR